MTTGQAPKQLRQGGATTGQKLVWDGTNWVPSLQDNLSATIPPTVSNDSTQGYEIGSVWAIVTVPRRYFVCLDASVGAAVWNELATAAVSNEIFTVPSAVAVRDLVYVTGASTADRADNGAASTNPAKGVVVAKPTTTSAEVVFYGVVGGYAGLTSGALQFLGTTGGIIESSLPTTPGEVIQKVGLAINTTTLLFDPDQRIVL